MSIGRQIIHLRAKLSELKIRLEKIKRQAAVHFIELQEILDPFSFETDFTKVDTERAGIHYGELHRLCEEGRKINRQIELLEKDLNG
jgi:hypothetical protein